MDQLLKLASRGEEAVCLVYRFVLNVILAALASAVVGLLAVGGSLMDAWGWAVIFVSAMLAEAVGPHSSWGVVLWAFVIFWGLNFAWTITRDEFWRCVRHPPYATVKEK